MSKNIVEELPARKHTPVAAPVAAKKEDGKADPKGCLLYTSPSPRDRG